ncbi:MAG: hypothetical protein ACJ73U_05520, partial [Actinophytocola sp.]
MQVSGTSDLRTALERALPPSLHLALHQAIAIISDLGIPAYLVGGPVRDLLLGRPVEDLDLVVEGDALAVADRFASLTGASLTRHEAFRTAKVPIDDGDRPRHLDFVTARDER